jgi:hypothetical protein
LILAERLGSRRRILGAAFLTSHGQSPELSIPKHFAKLKGPRRAKRRLHLLQGILVISVGAVTAEAQDWQEIETFGRISS